MSRSNSMQMFWLGIAIAATVGYHVVIKATPAGANPYLSLAVTYSVAAVAFIALFAATSPSIPLRESFGHLNWTTYALGVVVVFLDLGFLMLYRGGFDV